MSDSRAAGLMSRMGDISMGDISIADSSAENGASRGHHTHFMALRTGMAPDEPCAEHLAHPGQEEDMAPFLGAKEKCSCPRAFRVACILSSKRQAGLCSELRDEVAAAQGRGWPAQATPLSPRSRDQYRFSVKALPFTCSEAYLPE